MAETTTTQQSEFFGPGTSVEVGKIQRELKKLWQQSDQTATRASRLNLVIYNSGESSIRANTALVEQIARQHAIRAIIIAAKPQLPGNQRPRVGQRPLPARQERGQAAVQRTDRLRTHRRGAPSGIDAQHRPWPPGQRPADVLLAAGGVRQSERTTHGVGGPADLRQRGLASAGGAVRARAAHQRGVGPGAGGAGRPELDAPGGFAVRHRAIFRRARCARFADRAGIRGDRARARRGRADPCPAPRRLAGGTARLEADGGTGGRHVEFPHGERRDRDREAGRQWRRGRRRHPARGSARGRRRRRFHGQPRRGFGFLQHLRALRQRARAAPTPAGRPRRIRRRSSARNSCMAAGTEHICARWR